MSMGPVRPDIYAAVQRERDDLRARVAELERERDAFRSQLADARAALEKIASSSHESNTWGDVVRCARAALAKLGGA